MKVLIAIDSFKGSLSSSRAGEAAREGVLNAVKDAEVRVFPVADGGEGTSEVLLRALGGQERSLTVTDPLGRKITARYGIADKTAIIEMAAAAGITLLREEELDPMRTTTFGVGEMIRDAIRCGCRDFLIGIGGSATNDGGIGMLEALGFRFSDADGNPAGVGAKALERIRSVSGENAMPELRDCRFRIACDVTNPLCGAEGASRVFGPQKGADAQTALFMDAAMSAYADVVKEYEPSSDRNAPGAGAAGGLGFAFLSFLPATLHPGIELVLAATGMEDAISWADIVLTGEGRLDAQSAMGKVPSGIGRLARKHRKPVLAFAGSVSGEASLLHECGVTAVFPILRTVMTLEEAMKEENAYRNLALTAEQVFRLIKEKG